MRGKITLIISAIFVLTAFGIVSEAFGGSTPIIVLNPPINLVSGSALDIRIHGGGEDLSVVLINTATGEESETISLTEFSGTKGWVEILPPGFDPIDDWEEIPNFIVPVGDIITVRLEPDVGVTKSILVVSEDTPLPHIPGLTQQVTFNLYETCRDLNGDGITDNDNDEDFLCDTWENGGNNQIILSNDIDGDGTPDDITGDGIPDDIGNDGIPDTYMYDCMADQSTHGKIPCDENTPDIFVELDWIEGHRPENTAVATVVNAFLAKGINLHIQTDTAFVRQHDPEIPYPGLNDQQFPEDKGFDQIKGTNFGTAKEKVVYPTSWDATDPHRILKHQFFHYGLFVHENENDLGSSGIGETNGNDFMISLGSFTGNVGSIDQQAGTLMHELGHNLGLLHGGGDNINNKPNYFSVMSYSRQFADLDPNRPLDYSEAVLGHSHTPGELKENNLLEGNSTDLWGIEPYPGHNEGVIYACPSGALGPLYYKAGTVVNWDCDSTIDDKKVVVSINNLANEPSPPPINQSLLGFNDWSELEYNFIEHGDAIDGIHTDVAPGRELSIEGVTKNRISHLLSLYNEVYKLDEHDFKPFTLVSYEENNSTPKITFIQTESGNALPAITQTGKVSSISVNTDYEHYDEGDTILVSGQLATVIVDTPILLQVWFEGNLIEVAQLFPAKDGSYSQTITAEKPLWKNEGDYVIRISYGLGNIAETTISYTPDPEVLEPDPEDPTSQVSIRELFLFEIKEAIDQINHHDLEKTKLSIDTIDKGLELSLNNSNYANISPITGNLTQSYDTALNFIPNEVHHEEHKPVSAPIVEITEVEDMIEMVEGFNDHCRADQIGIAPDCECPAGTIDTGEACQLDQPGPDPFSGKGDEGDDWWIVILIEFIVFIAIVIVYVIYTKK